ncbi:MAG: hypothetical protein Q8930_09135 [Bacillota bacterium]|nr:hypothetical protein [Bacillota bacterium]
MNKSTYEEKRIWSYPVKILLKLMPVLIVLLTYCGYDAVINGNGFYLGAYQIKVALIVGGIISFSLFAGFKRMGLSFLAGYVVTLGVGAFGRAIDSYTPYQGGQVQAELTLIFIFITIITGTAAEAIKVRS